MERNHFFFSKSDEKGGILPFNTALNIYNFIAEIEQKIGISTGEIEQVDFVPLTPQDIDNEHEKVVTPCYLQKKVTEERFKNLKVTDCDWKDRQISNRIDTVTYWIWFKKLKHIDLLQILNRYLKHLQRNL